MQFLLIRMKSLWFLFIMIKRLSSAAKKTKEMVELSSSGWDKRKWTLAKL